MRGWVVVWQDWAPQKVAVAFVVPAAVVRRCYPQVREIDPLPDDFLLKILFDPDGNPISINADISGSFEDAASRSMVIAGIFFQGVR